jgi:putative transposase
MRKLIFANEIVCHILNRGVDKREVFLDERDYDRFLKGMWEFNNNLIREERERLKSELSSVSELSSDFKPKVEIIAYCLNPNHYHLILKQLEKGGIKDFMHKLGTGYTNYFNKKYDRSGSLFQGPFKAVHIDSNEYLLYVSAYVNKNNFIHGYKKDDSWRYSSWPEYLGKATPGICNKEIILNQFKNIGEYQEFVDTNALYLKEKKEAEKYLLE